MNSEKILEAARKNKTRGQEFENEESDRGNLLGTFVTILVGTILFLLEYYICKSINIGLVAVGMTFVGTQSLYEGTRIKKIHLIIMGAIASLIAIIAILAFIGQVILA